MFHELVQMNEEVAQAYHDHQPIVALESTLISQGMPHSNHLSAIHMIEETIRNLGVIPATIALYQGKIHIGINKKIFDHLTHDKQVIKASKRDLAFVLSQKTTATTTVATAMFCAHLAKLPLLVTGGIGGAQHHLSEHFDLSADLTELSSLPITVVCSGAKSILDLPKTLGMLETFGIAVIGYGTDEFPAFYSHSSGIPLLHRLDTVEEIATLMHYNQKLTTNKGVVIANPIPKEAEIPDDKIIPIIKQAQMEAKQINSKTITPFLLRRIAELTTTQNVQANLELIKSNAILGAKVAIAYQQQRC